MAVSLMVTGCTAELSTMLNRDLRTDTVSFREQDAFVVVSTTGERRSTFFKVNGQFCPENFPDVGRATNAKTDIQGPLPGITGTAQLHNQFATTLTQTNQRSESADIVGRLGAIICVAYLNGAISPSEYAKMVNDLVSASIVRIKQAPPPSRPTTTPQAAGTSG